MEGVRVKKGKILVYRVFDIASEIDLSIVEKIFEQKNIQDRFKLDRKTISLIISNAPVRIQLGQIEFTIQDKIVPVDVIAKVWHFGTLSLMFQIPIQEGTSWDDLVKTAAWLEADQEIDNIARNKAREFSATVDPALTGASEWDQFEDYVTYFIQELDGFNGKILQLPEVVDIPALLIAESKEKLSDQIRKATLENLLQYSQDDLAIIDWNSALIIEPNGSLDVPLVVEFALGQLLEMRYYDDLLDQKLNTLYNGVVGRQKGLLSNTYSRLAEEAGQIYLETAEIVETVENSMKVVGDFYLATIFRSASKRFRFDDWQKSINEKLSNLAEVSKLLHTEVNESRSHLLEIIIIVLITIEVVPFLYGLFR